MKIVQTIILLCFLITFAIAKCGIRVQCPPLNNPTANCTLESDNSACPRCVCVYQEPKKPKHASKPQCSPPRCDAPCRLNYDVGPDECPSCECGDTTSSPKVLCSPPKCGKDCTIDNLAHPCPSCKCGGSNPASKPQCSPPRCDAPCRLNYDVGPDECPSCECGDTTSSPKVLCSPPKCGKDCTIDNSTTPCPSCKCGGSKKPGKHHHHHHHHHHHKTTPAAV